MNALLYPLVIPALAGIVPLFVPRKGKVVAGLVALAAAVWTFLLSIRLFGVGTGEFGFTLFDFGGGLALDFGLRLYSFSAVILLFVSLFAVLIVLYSIGYLWKRDTSSAYYSFILWTLAAAAGAVLSANLLMLLIFWEMLTLLLYLLVNMGGPGHEEAGLKCFAVLGISDAALMLGVLLAWFNYGTLDMSRLVVSTATPTGVAIFLLLFAGAIAKAGAMPLHSWVPAIAKSTHASVMAFLPAALDKLLGIYLLARISLDICRIQGGSALSLVMMIVGAVTILFAVLMALVQHDLKKLLSFHAVSQVGYMVLGVGSGIPVAIVGGLFHMLNNAVYKSGLFLSAGAVEKRAGTTELDKLGGLARLMPVTFVTTLVAALSISGVPPFNGFASKWLVYQGMLEGRQIVFLVVAIFGSALTLASFVKVIHSLFLGRRPERLEGVREVDFSMQLPMIFLAILCVAFGVFARYPIERFIAPAVGSTGIVFTGGEIDVAGGLWSPGPATVMIVIGVVVGLLLYALSNMRHVRVDENPWVGGNIMDREETRIPGTHFYKTVTELNPLFSAGFRDGEKGALDPYNVIGRLGGAFVQVLRGLHNGILSTYLSWAIIGLGVIAFILMFHF
ncbi:MAG: hypothetical protein JW876_01775 [Candidatus Krumholzibacteriota bacterium]|nr:hypothetical protein [Candidatus Krumholzibacteriota bacterium]